MLVTYLGSYCSTNYSIELNDAWSDARVGKKIVQCSVRYPSASLLVRDHESPPIWGRKSSNVPLKPFTPLLASPYSIQRHTSIYAYIPFQLANSRHNVPSSKVSQQLFENSIIKLGDGLFETHDPRNIHKSPCPSSWWIESANITVAKRNGCPRRR